MKWKDVSSYSRTEKRVPNSFQMHAGMLRLGVHRHIHHPGAWCVSCEPFWSARPLNAETPEAAKAEAEGMLTRALKEALEDLK